MKKIIKGILNTFFAFIVTVFIALVIMLCVGIKPYIVLSGSMEPAIKTGSMAFVNTKYNFDDVEKEDIIAYKAPSGALVTHRVIDIQDGILETKGDNNDVSDGFCVDANNFYGMTIITIPQLGYIFAWLQTKRGMILAGTILCTSLIFEYALSIDDESGDSEKQVAEEEDESAKEK